MLSWLFEYMNEDTGVVVMIVCIVRGYMDKCVWD